MDVIIVGLTDNRSDILNDISERSTIIGYADIKKYYRPFASFDYVPYYEVSLSTSISFDYLVIGYKNTNDIQAVKEELIEAGMSTEKVIEYQLFKETLCIDLMKVFSNTDRKFDMFLFGMSHSQCSVQPQYFNQRLFKFAAPSMDLFCQRKIIDQLLRYYSESISRVSKFVFELPYYIFNYDLSRFKQFVLNRLYYFHTFSDYHHFGEKEGERELIMHFENFVQAFDRDKRSDKFTLNKDADTNTNNGFGYKAKLFANEVLRKREIRRFKDDVWFKDYVDTQKENAGLWKDILDSIRHANPAAEIVILVCPFDPLFRKLYKVQIEIMKARFYNMVGNVRIIDNFETNDNYHFFDHCHLKTECGLRYTQLVRKQLGEC